MAAVVTWGERLGGATTRGFAPIMPTESSRSNLQLVARRGDDPLNGGAKSV